MKRKLHPLMKGPVVLEHAQEFFTIELKIGFQPPVKNWWEIPDTIEKQDSVTRRIEIIGEAVKNISSKLRVSHPEIEWKKITGTRDILIHAYFSVDEQLLWDIVENKLPILKKQIEHILKEETISAKGKQREGKKGES